MKRFIVCLLMISMMLALFCGCGNKKLFDTTYTFDYAIIALPDGTKFEGKVKSWQDYEGEQIQITFENGETYLTSSVSAVLIANYGD